MLWFENIHETYICFFIEQRHFLTRKQKLYIFHICIENCNVFENRCIYILIYISHIYIYINGIDDGSNNNSDKTMVITVLAMTITVLVMIIPVLVMIVTVLL